MASNESNFFMLGGLPVPWRAALGYDQQVEPIEATTVRRTINGTAIKQTAWAGKVRVTLSGNGWAPIGADSLDYSQPLELRCAMPRAVRAQVAAITLPTTRRADAGYAPFAQAHLADGTTADTPVALAGNVATCTAVPTAVGYAVWYWPQYTVYASPPTEGADSSRAEFAWQLVCEEV